MNWNDYRFLLAVDTCGSLAGAARRLGVSQPTVSRRVAALARDLNAELLDCRADGARLSAIGRRICEQARKLELQASLIELNARSGFDDGPRRVTVSASEGLTHAIVLPLLARLRHLRPDIAVDLTTGNRLTDVRRKEAEIALRMGDPTDETLVGRKVGVAQFGLFGHDRYLAEAGYPRRIEDLDAHRIIESQGDLFDLPQAIWLREAAPDAPVALSSTGILNQVRALTLGFGLVTAPTYLVQGRAGIRRLLSDFYRPEIDVWLLTDVTMAHQEPVRAVIDHLAAGVPGRLADFGRAVQ